MGGPAAVPAFGGAAAAAAAAAGFEWWCGECGVARHDNEERHAAMHVYEKSKERERVRKQKELNAKTAKAKGKNKKKVAKPSKSGKANRVCK